MVGLVDGGTTVLLSPYRAWDRLDSYLEGHDLQYVRFCAMSAPILIAGLLILLVFEVRNRRREGKLLIAEGPVRRKPVELSFSGVSVDKNNASFVSVRSIDRYGVECTVLVPRFQLDIPKAGKTVGFEQEMAFATTTSVPLMYSDSCPRGVVGIAFEGNALGMGFCYGDCLVTAAHVMAGLNKSTWDLYSLYHPMKKTGTRMPKLSGGKVLYMDADLDLAVVKLTNNHWSAVGVRPAKVASAKEKDVGFLYVFDEGRQPAFSSTQLSAIGHLAFAHRCNTAKGDSGSPIYNGKGSVIGLHQGANHKNGYNQGIVLNFLFKLCKQLGEANVVEPESESSKDSMYSEDYEARSVWSAADSKSAYSAEEEEERRRIVEEFDQSFGELHYSETSRAFFIGVNKRIGEGLKGRAWADEPESRRTNFQKPPRQAGSLPPPSTPDDSPPTPPPPPPSSSAQGVAAPAAKPSRKRRAKPTVEEAAEVSAPPRVSFPAPEAGNGTSPSQTGAKIPPLAQPSTTSSGSGISQEVSHKKKSESQTLQPTSSGLSVEQLQSLVALLPELQRLASLTALPATVRKSATTPGPEMGAQ